MAQAKTPQLFMVALASCLLLLQLAPRCVQSARAGPASGLDRRSLLQAPGSHAAATTSSSTPSNDIPMAPLSVLNESWLAANLSSFAYPGTVLNSDDDVEASYTDPVAFQKYATALAAATSAYSSHTPTTVQRLYVERLHPELSGRFLYAFVLPAEGAVYVAFRGTDLTGASWFSVNSAASAGVDANSIQTPFKQAAAGHVHSGFYLSLTEPNITSYDSYDHNNTISAYQELAAAIKAAQAQVGADVPVVLTGHSLGAAQASVAAYLLSLDGFTNLRLYTFGNPQIGDADWRAAFDAALGSNHLAWWNMDDPVVQIPNSDIDPGCFSYGSRTCTQTWFSAGTRYRINTLADGSLRCGQPSGSYAVCDERSNSQPPANQESCWTDISLKAAFDEPQHSITAYQANLQACAVVASNNN